MSTTNVLRDVFEERQRQDAKWGSISSRYIPHAIPRTHYAILTAETMKRIEKERAAYGFSAWVDVLLEEVAEAVDEAITAVAESTTAVHREEAMRNLRTELIQVAAVAVCWAEAIDIERFE